LTKDAKSIEVKIGGCEEKLAVEYIVCFDKDDGLTNFSLGLGLIRMVGQAEVNMLLRREYQIIWDKNQISIEIRYTGNTICCHWDGGDREKCLSILRAARLAPN
jgi:hypothetical protein